jgi:hypothetical protein
MNHLNFRVVSNLNGLFSIRDDIDSLNGTIFKKQATSIRAKVKQSYYRPGQVLRIPGV